jgi:glycosyltransferase involved in cell wall biosynthesis
MKTVLLRAPLLTQSGYGVHARQVARWLFDRVDSGVELDVHTELLNWGGTPWYTDVYAQDGLIGRCLQASSYRREQYDVTIQLQLPNEWCPELGKFNVGMTAGVEADVCNPIWVGNVNKMNLVIVPSEFTKKTFVDTAAACKVPLTTPIVVVPEAFPDVFLDQDKIAPLPFEPETKFNFLVFGQATGGDAAADRKNLPYTLKWLFEAFHDKPEVGVILKTNMGRYSKVDRLVCENTMKKLLAEIGKREDPRFYLLHGDMTDTEVCGLYKHPSVKALVSLTHGEGFGLPLLEAAACGLPVIATDWSAHTEFLGHGKYIKIEQKPGTIPQARVDNQIWMNGSRWAMPNEEDFKKRVVRFYEQSSTPREWARDLKKKIHEKYSFAAISNAYNATLGEVL